MNNTQGPPTGAVVCFFLFPALLALLGLILVIIITIREMEEVDTTGEYRPLSTTRNETEVPDNGAQPWKEILRNYMENVPAFLFVHQMIYYCLSGFFQRPTFVGVYLAFIVLMALFVFSRFAHAILMKMGNAPIRGVAFCTGALMNILLALFGFVMAVMSMDSGGLVASPSVLITAAVVVVILVVKLYAVHFYVGRSRHSGNLAVIPKFLNITRNDVESYVAVAGILPIFLNSTAAAKFFLNYYSLMTAALFWLCLYTASRVSHTIVYALGLQPWRSIMYSTGLLSLLILGWFCTGLFLYIERALEASGQHVFKAYSAFLVLLVLDIMRTWIVGFGTAVARSKAGDAIAEEDKSLPGFNPDQQDSQYAALSQSLQETQTKDNYIQIIWYLIMHAIGMPIAMKDPEADGYIALLFFFFFSRILYTVGVVLRLKPRALSCITLSSVVLLLVMWFWNFSSEMKWITNSHHNMTLGFSLVHQ